MKIDDVRDRAFAMPLTNPSYPPGPYRFINHEYLIVTDRTEITVKGAREGPAGLELRDHALAPVAQLLILEVISAVRILTDLIVGLGEVVFDYLQPGVKA